MPSPVDFRTVARLAAPRDNVAIAIRRIDAGTAVEIDGAPYQFPHTVLEGHRFAVRPIAVGEALTSWSMPFGRATSAIAPGEALSNPSMIEALAVRRLGLPIPTHPNFTDQLSPYQLDEAAFRAAPAVPLASVPRTFRGYRRPDRRGIGTRNTIVILGTTSRTAAFVRQLAARLAPLARVHPQLDGIVAVAHTEGGGPSEPNNAAEVLRALAGFMVSPNVGAVLAVDHGNEPIPNERLRRFMVDQGYPLADVPHAFLSVRSGLAAGLAEAERLVRGWLPAVSALARTAEPLSGLRVALQCGGSDAFSGVSGNPLAGAMVHELIRQGGTGVLCETDELSGAEAYVMANIRDLPTARKVLGYIEAFRNRLAWHGVTPESNPSAGNKLRGLYNIALKSLGAVHKKDPRTRIDHVIDYAEPLREPGFYFMNSPGNDLEGIAGQAAAGCNLFLFATGNGSITNFPFVPTLKLTTTTRRHELLSHEMDLNAGRYLDGETMEALSAESFELLVRTASGERTKGELAGHSQTSLWRNWQQTDASQVGSIRSKPVPDGRPLRASAAAPAPTATERIGLILPTSMCAAQIARLAADRLNASPHPGVDRFVALAHSEGCGFGGESMYRLLHRTYRGYATHPNVAAALLLEHGCEKIPNDAMRRQFELAGLPLERFGWSSVQLDGGIDKSLANIGRWFGERLAASSPAVAAGPLSLALLSAGPAGREGAQVLGALANHVLAQGGSLVIAESDPLLAHADFRASVMPGLPPRATLSYGEAISLPGLHIVDTETDHWVENLTGLGACGVHLFVGLVGDAPQQGHPLLPLIQVLDASQSAQVARQDVDLVLGGDVAADLARLLTLVGAVTSGAVTPAATAGGFVDFQLSRGLLGVST